MEARLPYFTPEEYLEMEHRADYRSEYVNGLIYAMAGASRSHGLLCLSIGSRLEAQLRRRPCEAFVSEMRVKVADTGMYTYPDIVVACGDIRYERAETDTLMSPTVIIEVLSPSTEQYDRGSKFAHYRQVPSLRDYVLVSQDRMLVEHYARSGEQWILTALDDPAGILRLASIECELVLRDIYERVELPDNPPGR